MRRTPLVSNCRYLAGVGLLFVASLLILVAANRAQVAVSSGPQRSAANVVVKGAAGSGLHKSAESGAKGSRPQLAALYGRLPLAFEANSGQADGVVKFISRGHGYTMFLTGDAAVLELRKAGQQSKVEGGKEGTEEQARTLLPSQDSFFGAATNNQPVAADALSITNHNSQITNPPVPDPRNADPAVLRLGLVGANPQAKVTGMDELPGKSNYFLGNDPNKWRTNVANYARVKYENVYPGVDLVYYGNQGQLEHDFVVAPGADPGAIRLAIEAGNAKLETGESRLTNHRSPIAIDPNGDLVISTDAGEVRFRKPVVYQTESKVGSRQSKGSSQLSAFSGEQTASRESRSPNPGFSDHQSQFTNHKSVEGRYALLAGNRIGFEVGAYDKSRPLVIDPVLSYATYLGGSQSDFGIGIAVDSVGDTYISGQTFSANFPFKAGSLDTSCGGGCANPDGFVVKLSADGSALLYSTFLGGSNYEHAIGVTVDGAGNAYVIGQTRSADFPTTASAFQKTVTDGTPNGFVTKLNAAGTALVYSTYLTSCAPLALAIDSGGFAYVTGAALSASFPTKNALQATFGGGTLCSNAACPDAFVTKVNTTGSDLVYSTFLGTQRLDVGTGVAVDSSGNAYVGGYTESIDFVTTAGAFQTTYNLGFDGFVVKLNPDGSTRLFSTFLGGSDDEFPQSLAIDSADDVIVTGWTTSTDFPTANPSQAANAGDADAFISELNPSGSALVYSTYLGGTLTDHAYVIEVAASDDIYVVGATNSTNFPLVDPIQAANGGSVDIFITRIDSATHTPDFSTYLGGNGQDAAFGGSVAVDGLGNIFITAETTSTDMPTGNVFQPALAGTADAYVAKISPADVAGITFVPVSLGFGNQLVGTTSAAMTATLRNSGSQALTISNITLSGADAAQFTLQSNTCPASPTTLAGGDNCTLGVTFHPDTALAMSAEILVASDALNNPHHLPLSGTGRTGPVAHVDKNTLDLGLQLVDGSTQQSLTLSNIGDQALNITSITPSPTTDFSSTSTCGASLAPAASCTVTVTFAPSAAGPRAGTLTITTNDVASPAVVALVGTGTDFAVGTQTGGSLSATVTAGATGVYNLQIAPTGLSGSVSVTCAFQGSTPRGAGCSVASSPVSVNGVDPAPFTVNATTTARSLVAPQGNRHPRGGGYPPLIPVALGLMLLAAVAAVTHRRSSPALRWAPLAATLLLLVFWTACGGGGGGGGGGGTTPRGTPAGTYNLTVTATSGGVSRTAALTLTVN
ncbi:MAG: choice-of-anchor D domain-containing protein [Terriglobia bacterium]